MLEEIKGDTNSLLKVLSITKAQDFTFIRHNSKCFYSREIKILSGKLGDIHESIYLGFKISKKVGNAVHRNKLRRRIKAVIREVTLSTPSRFLASQALVFIPNKNIISKPYSDIHTLLIKALSFLYSRQKK